MIASRLVDDLPIKIVDDLPIKTIVSEFVRPIRFNMSCVWGQYGAKMFLISLICQELVATTFDKKVRLRILVVLENWHFRACWKGCPDDFCLPGRRGLG